MRCTVDSHYVICYVHSGVCMPVPVSQCIPPTSLSSLVSIGLFSHVLSLSLKFSALLIPAIPAHLHTSPWGSDKILWEILSSLQVLLTRLAVPALSCPLFPFISYHNCNFMIIWIILCYIFPTRLYSSLNLHQLAWILIHGRSQWMNDAPSLFLSLLWNLLPSHSKFTCDRFSILKGKICIKYRNNFDSILVLVLTHFLEGYKLSAFFSFFFFFTVFDCSSWWIFYYLLECSWFTILC